MDKKAINIFIFLLLSETFVFAQHLSHQVLVPAAGISISNRLSYNQTIGETAIEVISCSGYVFTQGFQQPGIEVLQEIPSAVNGNGIEVFPNPATDHINIKLFGDCARNFRIEIINSTGMLISSATINFISSYYHNMRLEVNSLVRGLYFVRVVSMDGLINRSFKIEKM